LRKGGKPLQTSNGLIAGKKGLPDRITLHRWRRSLKADDTFEATNVAIAAVLGVTHTTVERDLSPGTNVPSNTAKLAETADSATESGTNVPSAPPPRTIEIRRMDFRELLGSLTNVDAIITDPPARARAAEARYDQATEWYGSGGRGPRVTLHVA
jgi:hypothetical protein